MDDLCAVLAGCPPHDVPRVRMIVLPEWARELARLRADGHTAQRTRRHWLVTPSPDALRCTLLWRTLLHELGHIADHARCLSGKG